MHDCLNTREQLVDLVFDELDQDARRRVLLELESCHDCQVHYRSVTETLSVVDQAVEMALPDENYWPGYEAGLRNRLQQERLNLKQRLVNWIGGFGISTARPLQLGAGMALALLAIGCWWILQSQQTVTPDSQPPLVVTATATPTPQPETGPSGKEIAVVRKPGGISNTSKKIAQSDGRSPSLPREEPRGEEPRGEEPRGEEPRGEEPREVIIANNVEPVESGQLLIAGSIFTPEAIKHFEKSQLLLRTFRNTRAANGSAATDLAYEKQLSQRLLYQNILLRREAEMKGNLPAEEALGDLEPFLLDIANLPDKPSPDELSSIKERLQRKELIATLHIYSAHPSLPTYQNQ
jgi:hypothetical protein